MQVPVMADAEQVHHANVSEPIRCAVVVKPTEAQRYKKEMLRYVVLGIALLAVLLLIAIALYYTEGNSVTIKQVSSLAPHLVFARLS
jgi:formate hydrogenlyase subunit 3/multisubunit Na+/H+ antiporter MnhD subunit